MSNKMGKILCTTKAVMILFVNVSFLVTGILLYLGDTSLYGMVIDYETSQWSDYAIIDVLSSGSQLSCP